MDEFGAGTNGKDGTAILASTIRHMEALSNECPLTLFSTHFSEILRANNRLEFGPMVQLYTMDFAPFTKSGME